MANKPVRYQKPQPAPVAGVAFNRTCIALPASILALSEENYVYVTPLNSDIGVFGYIVSPSGLEKIVVTIGPNLERYMTSRSIVDLDWAVITAIHALDVLPKLRVKSGQICPPRTHLSTAGRLWFLPRDGYAVVGSDPKHLGDYKEYSAKVQAAVRQTVANHCHSQVEARLARSGGPPAADIQKIKRAFNIGLWKR